MFKVEYFVEDKKLADSLRALAGLARGLPSVVPVVNVDEGHPSGLKPVTNGALLEAFEVHIAKLDKPFKPNDVREFLKSMGKAPGSYSYLLQRALKARLIKKSGVGTGTIYQTVKRLAAPKKEQAHG